MSAALMRMRALAPPLFPGPPPYLPSVSPTSISYIIGKDTWVELWPDAEECYKLTESRNDLTTK